MNATLQLAMAKVLKLPDETQEWLGLELLDRLATLERLRADLGIGIKELDAGLGAPLDIEDVIRRGKERVAQR